MDNIDYKKKCEEYEKILGIGKDDPAQQGYLVMVKILRQQNEYLDKIEIKNLITSEEKGKLNEYERAKALWEKLPSIIESVNTLKYELEIEKEEKKTSSQMPVSPQTIALNGKVNNV